MNWTDGSGRICLNITKPQAAHGSHPGQCDVDISELRQAPAIRRQLAKLDPEIVRDCLREYGGWDDSELAEHEKNLDRLLWCACGDIVDGNY